VELEAERLLLDAVVLDQLLLGPARALDIAGCGVIGAKGFEGALVFAAGGEEAFDELDIRGPGVSGGGGGGRRRNGPRPGGGSGAGAGMASPARSSRPKTGRQWITPRPPLRSGRPGRGHVNFVAPVSSALACSSMKHRAFFPGRPVVGTRSPRVDTAHPTFRR